MITFTKEQLIASAHARIEFAEMMLAGELEPLVDDLRAERAGSWQWTFQSCSDFRDSGL